MPAALLGLAAAGIVLWGAGCGGDDGVAAGATVRVYVGADLCPGAQRALGGGEEAGEVELEAVCLKPVGRPGALDLATVGANARRATEDASAIAYVESKGPANRFAQPIVEEAGIASTLASSGSAAATRVLKALEQSGSGSLRDEVREALETG
jgi:hypothetical protein